MEVHAHTHPAPAGHRKKWTHYLWEFLMLFLAVFCGFLAENQREHLVEHQREKQYMRTMLEDLRSDIPLLENTLKDWESVNNSIDSVTDALSPGGNTDWRKVYRHLHEALNYYSFSYNDRTIAQLKNAGAFRLLRKKEVAGELIAYDQFNQDAVKNIAVQHNQLFLNCCAIRSRFLREDIISAIERAYPNRRADAAADPLIDSLLLAPGPGAQQVREKALLFEFRNNLIALRRDYDKNMMWSYGLNSKRIAKLIGLIKKEYHLE